MEIDRKKIGKIQLILGAVLLILLTYPLISYVASNVVQTGL